MGMLTTFKALLLSSVMLSQTAYASENKVNLVVFGDSATVGTLGNTTIGVRYNPLLKWATSVIPAIFSFGAGTDLEGEAVLNETKMGRVNLLLSNNDMTPWLGKESYSLPVKFEKALGQKVEVHNFAFPGMSWRMVGTRIDKLDAKVNKEKFKADYIVLDLGGIDFMINSSISDFKAHVTQNLKRIASTYASADIIITGIQPMMQVLNNVDRAASFDGEGNPVQFCADIFKEAGIGLKLKLGRDAKPSDVDFQSRRLAQMEAVLENAVEELNLGLLSERYEGKARYIAIDQDVDDSQLAADCLHPSQKGHETVANIVWEQLKGTLSR